MRSRIVEAGWLTAMLLLSMRGTVAVTTSPPDTTMNTPSKAPPTTAGVTTIRPTTNAQTTPDVTTPGPTTNAQTTPDVTTSGPTTNAQTTLDPTTVIPTTPDGEPPVITCPDNAMGNTNLGESQGTVTWDQPTATDNVDGVVPSDRITCNAVSGVLYDVGVTDVGCTATDAGGNTDTCSFTVTVVDDEDPVITCPDNALGNTNLGESQGTVTWDQPIATDNVDGVVPSDRITCNAVSGVLYDVGVTDVGCTATDAGGNTDTCSFNVTVVDDEDPVITCPDNALGNTNLGESQGTVTWDQPTATDNVDGVVPSDRITCNAVSGVLYDVGVTDVGCTATDAGGNTDTCSFNVTVVDDEDPVITCPDNALGNTNLGESQGTVTWDQPTATDNVDGVVPSDRITCNAVSGSLYDVGVTDVGCTATDAGGNTDTCSFNVTVVDNEKPIVTCPVIDGPYSTDPGDSQGTVTWEDPSVTENVDENLEATCDPASGSKLNVSTLTVTCTATDNAMNTGTCEFDVSVEDNEAPVLNCSANTELQMDPGMNYATFDPLVTASDNVDNVAPECTGIPSTNKFYDGVTNVSCSATDNSGNIGKCNFTVTVSDQELPIFPKCIEQTYNQLLDDNDKADVNYTTPMVQDNVGVVTGPECSPASGNKFNKGSTLVTCIAFDEADNRGECLFNVTLIDCSIGTYGPNCMNCTCVNNTLCEPTTGNCPGCVDDIEYGFECNYMDLNVNIYATDLDVINNYVTQHREGEVELICTYNVLNVMGQLSKDGEVLKNFTGDPTGNISYTISSVDFDDVGVYTCTVNPLYYTDVVPPVFTSVTVNVEVPAEIIMKPEDQSGRLQNDLTFTCMGHGTPIVDVTWIDNNGIPIRMIEGKYNISESVFENNSLFTTVSTLGVYNLSRADNERYECKANNTLVNKVEEPVESFNIIVLEKPDPVIGLNTVARADYISVFWSRGINRNSPIQNCTVKYKDSGSDFMSEIAENDDSHTIDDLVPFTSYTIEVFCTNAIGDSVTESTTQKTDQTAPTSPRNLNAEYSESENKCRLTWIEPEQLNGVLQTYTVKYDIASVDTPTIIEKSLANAVNNTLLDIQKLSFHSVYTFVVTGTTVEEGSPSNEATFETIPGAPSVITVPEQPADKEVKHDSFKVKLEEPVQRNGPVSCYAVIVVQLEDGESVEGTHPDIKYKEEDIRSYEEAKDNKYVPYVAVAYNNNNFNGDITIGSGGTTMCNPSTRRKRAPDTYPHAGDNGKLNSKTTYTVFLRAYIDENVYSSSPFVTPVSTGSNKTPIIVVVVIIIILLVVVIVLLAFVTRHRRHDFINQFRRPSKHESIEIRSIENEGYLQEYPAISVERLEPTFEEKHRDNDKLFNQEYKSLPASSRPVTTEASSLQENRGKNRYINILAYDHSRVILTEIEGLPGSDYINACYVDGFNFQHKFIAAQGPKEETVVDFWRMIWEQRSPAIIMLTKTFEKGREKCAQYWPDSDSQEFEQFTITLEDTVKTCEYVIRKFRVQNSDYDEEARSIHQYHFIGWPDFGIPDYPYTMLSFIKRIRQMVPKATLNGDVGPLTVHCSAGVGRTGTYIVIDTMLDQMAAEKQVDIYNFVSRIRGQRNLLVQSQVQYVFIHKSLMEDYLYKESEIDVTSMQKKWSDLIQKPVDSDFSNLELEFRRVTQIQNPHLTQKDGTLEPNKVKNRLLQVVPYDGNRVKLQRLIGKEHSDYINASYIDGYEYKAMYIATQGPTKDTTGDFWRMVWDERTACIIMMTDLEENGQEKCFQYWPEDITPVIHDTIAVQVKDQREMEGSEYIVREFQVTNTKGGESRSVFQYHYVGWPHSSVPTTGTGLVDLIGKVHKYQESIHSTFPIVVHCSGGAGRTGVFIALSIMLERVKAEGLIDVFQTVRTLRQQRPHMVQNFEQYGFCYHAVREYMDSFDHYANLK